MTEAGNDPRLKNKASLTPYQLVDPSNVALRAQLRDAVELLDLESEAARETGGQDDVEEEEGAGDDYAGSASDSDFDPEEYRRERERQKVNERKDMEGGMI